MATPATITLSIRKSRDRKARSICIDIRAIDRYSIGSVFGMKRGIEWKAP